MLKNSRYRITHKTVQELSSLLIKRDENLISTKPFISTFEIRALAANGGTHSYTAEKVNYKSNVQYKAFLIRNPKFTDITNNKPKREYERVIAEYGDGARSFNTPVSQDFSALLSDKEGLQPEKKFDPGVTPDGGFDENDVNFYSEGNVEKFSIIPEYTVTFLKYVNGRVDTTYSQVPTKDNEFVLEYDLVSESNRGGGETPGVSVVPVTIKVTGEPTAVKLIQNSETTQVLSSGINELLVPEGTDIRLVSSDLSKFRITSVQLDGFEAGNSEENQSVVYDLKITESVALAVKTENVSQIPEVDRPIIGLTNDSVKKYNINSDIDLPIGITRVNKVDSVRVIIGEEEISFNKLGDKVSPILLLNKKYFTKLGLYKIAIIPRNEERGDGEPISVDVNVVSEVFVGVPDLRKINYPKNIKAADFVGFDVDFEISYESVDTDYIKLGILDTSYTSKVPSTGKIKLNFQELLVLGEIVVDGDTKETSITLQLTPFNTSGIEEVFGKTEQVTINFELGNLQIPRRQVANRFTDAFISPIGVGITNDDISKYLTHNLHLGEGDNKVIANWTGSEGTLIAKLYEPLPTAIQENQQVWISKLQSNPILETVTLSGDEELVCTPLKGPNFSLVPDNGLGYQIYDDLIGSGSATSDELINKYFDGLNIDTTKLDIRYTSGSTYLFENFVNFGSAEERVNNFFYKIQLVESYVEKLNSLTDGLELGQILTEQTPIDSSIDGYQAVSPVLFTEDEVFTLDVEQRVFRNPTEKIEADKVIEKLRTLLASFDGFENFLYTSTNDLAYPKVVVSRPITSYPITVLKNSNDTTVIAWYNSLVSLSAAYDKNNVNYMVNNIPLFVKDDTENSEFLLFLDMIGQHFDVLWVYINALKKLRKNDEAGIDGVPKEFVHTILKSFGWDGVRAYDSQFLWEYALGQYKDGKQKYSTSLEDANNQIWKRILNNLPYLLKHKGTSRAMKAIMATYGVPQSMLTIMEFGGPQDPTQGGTTDFTFDDRTAAFHLYPTSSVDIHWKEVSGEYPDSIEFMIKPHNLHSSTILSSSNFTLDIVETGSKAYLEFDLDGNVTQSLPFKYSTEDYSGILINKTSNNYEVLYKTSDGERIYIESSLQLDTTSSVGWVTESVVKIGNNFTGSLDEVRLWSVPLEESKFENHVLFPNAINGNSYTSSTSDLLVRLDFEYPIDLFAGTSTIPSASIKNVAINTTYGLLYATSSNFNEDYRSYPYNYIPYDRTVTAKVPSLGYNFSNKIRSESQELISNLSHKKRATKKAFDRSPIDSNRLGLFFSPIKELNMDILKTFGDFNVDNYIGSYNDDYKEEYSELKTLRNYYFERISRNSHEYIRLIKYISKSLFDVLESLAPARAKVSKGLLIEPHFLERSKTRWDKPTSVNRNWEAQITASEDVYWESVNQDYQGNLNVDDETNLIGEEKVYESLLDVDSNTTITSDERFFESIINEGLTGSFDSQYLTYTASISFSVGDNVSLESEAIGNLTQVGTDPNSLAVLGFGLFAEDKTTIWKRFNKEDNTLTSSRSDVYLLEKTLTRDTVVQTGGYPTIGSVEGDQVVFEVQSLPYIKKEVNILPYNSTEPPVVGDVTKVTSLKGYFPTHYRFTNGLSTGLERSFFEGSKQTTDTTPDGLSPVETFTTNPNILRVTDTGRGSGEPILEVD